MNRMADASNVENLIDKIAHKIRENPDFANKLIELIEKKKKNTKELDEVDELKRKILEKMERRAEFINNLPENWDEFECKTFEQKTIDLMKEVIISLIEALSASLHLLPIPHFSPLNDGTIDIHFKNDTMSLLINFSDDPDEISVSGIASKKADFNATLSKEMVTDILSGWVLTLLSK